MDRPLAIYLLLGATCFALSASLTWLLIHLAPRLGLVDEPTGEKFHRVPTPVGGGIAIYLALLPVLFVPATQSPHTSILLATGGLVALVGLIDDRRGVPAALKFVALLACTSLLWGFGVGASTTRLAALDFLITVIWVSGVASALNAVDNMDGLATGVSALAALCFLIIALQTQQWVLGGLSAALLGASLGFLLFNFPPARIFMGDTGSLVLGFLLASLGVLGDWNSNEVIAAIIPILVLGLPIFDLAFTVIRRHRNGITRTPLEAIRHCDTDHVSHRLVRIGLSPRSTVLLLYLVAGSFGISAVSLRNAAPGDGLLHLLQAIAIASALVPILCLAESARTSAGRSLDPPRRHLPGGALLWLCLLVAGTAIASLLG